MNILEQYIVYSSILAFQHCAIAFHSSLRSWDGQKWKKSLSQKLISCNILYIDDHWTRYKQFIIYILKWIKMHSKVIPISHRSPLPLTNWLKNCTIHFLSLQCINLQVHSCHTIIFTIGISQLYNLTMEMIPHEKERLCPYISCFIL